MSESGRSLFFVGLLVFLQWGAACTSTVTIHPVAEQMEHIKSRKTALPADLLEGSAQVEPHTLLVNRDFNMGLAMGMELIGPAIAAGQRISDNQNLAKKLAKAYDSNTAETQLKSQLNSCRSGCSKNHSAYYSYGLLYGHDPARLLTVLEWTDKDPQALTTLVAVSSAKALEGPKSWAEGDAINQASDQAYRRLVEILKQQPPKAKESKESEKTRCKLGDNRAVEGQALIKTTDFVVVQTADSPKILYVCPVEP